MDIRLTMDIGGEIDTEAARMALFQVIEEFDALRHRLAEVSVIKGNRHGVEIDFRDKATIPTPKKEKK